MKGFLKFILPCGIVDLAKNRRKLRDFDFFLANVSQPQVLNGRASMCDGLYVNPVLVREWVKPDFV